ncbi:MAG: TRAP transporter fused permease subunit [Deltaproteobacteria bacterium]|nr:MAG: TRAP transporter fused permease subunit [Deltaproteobacteria bacterium]
MAQRIDWLKFVNNATGVLAVLMGVYHLVYTRWLLQDPLMHQNTHLTFALLLIFLTTITKKPKLWLLNLVLIVLSFIAVTYVFVNYSDLAERAGIPTMADVIIGTIIVIVVLEACRQAFGWIVPAIAAGLMIYALVSSYLPPPFFHTPISYGKVISWSAIAFRGIYGMFLNISATYIILFILFGGLLQATGVSQSFMELGKAIGRKMRSGPGQTAVISSGLVGMVMGAGVANVAFTGPITIPIMKKAGYSPDQAGAVEAAASAGGQIMPPVMASAAFLMAGLLGITYGKIIIYAAIPGIIYFLSIGWAVHLLALRQGISAGVGEEEKIDYAMVWRRFPIFAIPLGLVIVLLSMDYSATLAAFCAVISILVLSFIRKETRLSWGRLVAGFRTGCVGASGLAMAIAAIGVVSSMISLTGVGVEVAFSVEQWSMGIPFIAIFVSMWVTILLGCGMPVVAAYALVAIVVAPILIRMGVGGIQTHFFILYFAAFSTLSPPVASAALMGSSISGGSYFKTAVEGMKIAATAFIIPWLILWNPNIIAHFSGLWMAIGSISATVVSIFILQAGLFGQFLIRLNVLERMAFIVVSAILIGFVVTQSSIMFVIGLVLFVAMLLEQIIKVR